MPPADTLAVALAHVWPVPTPWRLTPLVGGTNNHVFLVETLASSDYILRLAGSRAGEEHLLVELAILSAIAAEPLPFAIPVPLATTSGALYHPLSNPAGDLLATLTPRIPGAVPVRDDLAQAEAAGAALARLDLALAHVVLPGSLAAIARPPLGYLRQRLDITPDVDPFAPLAMLGVAPVDRARLAAMLATIEASMPAPYAALPRQIIHADCDPSNVLMDGPRVTGILDFEFASPDLRVAELGAPLTWWTAHLLGTGREWPVIAAFGRGYASVCPLTPAERTAIPMLLRLRAVGSLLHRLQRFQRGASPAHAVLQRVSIALERDAWLAANDARLSTAMDTWQRA